MCQANPHAMIHGYPLVFLAMSKEVVVIGLIAVAGFLIGGVYSTWKTARGLAMLLGVAAVVAVAGAIVWLVS